MKKLFAAILSATLLLCSCGNTEAPALTTEETEPPIPESVLEVEEMIDSIDIEHYATYTDNLIAKAEAAYNKLSSEEKKMVENYDTIKEAKEWIKDNVYSLDEKFAVEYISKFSKLYKNPHSVELYKVWVYTDTEEDLHYVAFDFSATNNVGGEIEDVAGNCKILEGGLEFSDESSMKKAVKDAYNQAKSSNKNLSKYWRMNKGLDLNGGVDDDLEEFFGYITAKSKGRELDVDKIQRGFDKNR